ncbi:unnamed protein product [Schistosoma mattheei]|uniref:Uncharacterized protein n=1 Tax=Schistosoma mattheei TaxID=31246 RepID=A0A183NK09_9TREM|nr:unnamed protein product [Schistosoma mattheei]
MMAIVEPGKISILTCLTIKSFLLNLKMSGTRADRTNFIDRLKSAKRRRVQTQKLDFVGVLTADSKGLCQLYKGLKDKEKSNA